MAKKSSAASVAAPAYPAIPPEVSGINVNFCKNPTCTNFGVPADLVRVTACTPEDVLYFPQ